ncbi:MAG: class I SAM-dependent methyltransferase [Anaerolineae bacterium]|nr:class I SAM-dependent methyltransferase [Anaerolineae bacterium]
MSEGDLSDKACTRGLPSYWWRAGQEYRLGLVQARVKLSGRRVLDAGCGVGAWAQALQEAGARVVGVDVEEERVADALARASGAGFVVASVECLPFGDASFDVVFSHEVLEHVEDDLQALREAARVLRPGGHLVLFVPNRGFPFETHGVVWRGKYRFGNVPLVNWLPDALRDRLAPHVRAYGRRQLAARVAAAGLEVRHHTQIFPGFDRLEEARPVLGRWLRCAARLLERTPLRALGISHFLVAQKPR